MGDVCEKAPCLLISRIAWKNIEHVGPCLHGIIVDLESRHMQAVRYMFYKMLFIQQLLSEPAMAGDSFPG